MKKITLLITLMITAFGFGQQVVIENFENSSTFTFAGFEGLGKLTANNIPPVVGAFIVADPASGGTRGLGLQLKSSSLGNPWQGAEVIFSASKIRLNNDDRTMKVDVYSTQNFTLLGKAEVGGGALPMATSANYTTPNQWQTLTFNFNFPKDGTTATNGEYAKIAFFPNWKSTDGWNIPPANFTIHLDNITGVKVTTAPAFVPPVAPSPSTPNAQVFSIYGDTGGFTNVFVPVESFGGNLGTPDLDTTAGVNQAIKMDFSNQGFGARLDDAAPIDISNYGFLNFNYYVQSGAANAGSLGHQFYFDLIHRTGANNIESFYGFGPTISSTGGPSEHVKQVIVFDSWQTVSIPLSSFVGFDKTKFLQWKLGSSSDLRTKVAFFDNIYFSVNNPSLGTESFQASNVKMYPNPAKNTLNIDANASIQKVSVYNILGQEVLSKKPNSNSTTLQTSGLQRGTYIVRSTIDGKTTTSKLIKE